MPPSGIGKHVKERARRDKCSLEGTSVTGWKALVLKLSIGVINMDQPHDFFSI